MSVQVLYETDRSRHEPMRALERRLNEGIATSSASAYAKLLIQGILENRENIDKIVAKLAPTWPIDQIAVVDKNILRVAIFEIMFGGDVPYKAAINEAVELAKIYGSDSSPKFVNGVLGSLMDEATLASEA